MKKAIVATSRLLVRLGLNSIFAKLLLISLSILVVTFLVYNLISSQLVGRDMLERRQGMEGAELRRTITLLETAAQDGWSDASIRTALQLLVPPQMKTFLIIDRRGRYMQVGQVPLPEQEIRELISSANLSISVEPSSDLIENASGKWIVSSQYAPSIDRYVVSLSTGVQRDFRRWQNLSWLAIASALAVSVVFSWMFSRYMTARIRRMSKGADNFAKGQFDSQIIDRSPDELGQLARSLNRMAADLGALEQMRRDFLANVSHDLRSPLTSIHGYIEAILDGTVPREKAERYLRITQDQTMRLMKLVDDLLDMSKIEAGQFDVHPSEFDLAEMIRMLLSRMESTFEHHAVRYEIIGLPVEKQHEPDGVLLPSAEVKILVVGDPHRLEQVMINLLQNAMAFSPNGSTIYVTLERRTDAACVTVRDEGIGMSEEQTRRIWERFYKSDESRGGHGGTGIGLSIVKHILDAHGSRIEVKSDPGRGSSFRFCLQQARPGANADAATES
ncbi:sensor histidine kinase [Paenibacillus herberti]|uniref:histidine kinase n=1 Tax=Paenibacillus herberti TaxID=1619309 RepID=A0A229NX17_9BACL|nr:HAMP domain-containing sensor histidine kinase [Paenibacillus herberti]OXM14159.1 hypothetical protein CGZ75_14405 [Paenibacillus herberti]